MTLIENFTIVVDAARVVSTSDAAQVIRSRISHTDKLTKAQHLILAEMVGFKDFK